MNTDRLQHLQSALAQIDDLIRAAVARAGAAGQDPTDALRGLVISQDEVETYLNQSGLAGLWPDTEPLALPDLPADTGTPLGRLRMAFRLTPIDSIILLLCLAPELDRRYERLYAYLQDDVSQRRPTVNLMMNLLGEGVPERFAVWERLAPDAPLRKHHLIEAVADASRPNSVFLAHILKVDHRIVAYLLNDAPPDERLKHSVGLVAHDPSAPLPEVSLDAVQTALPEAPIIYMKGAKGMGELEAASALCAAYDLPLVRIDAAALIALELPGELGFRLALREGYLHGAAIFIDGWESWLDDQRQPPPALLDSLLAYPAPVFLCGTDTWEPQDLNRARRMLRLSFSIPQYPQRYRVWEQAAGEIGAAISADDVEEVASKFRFSRTQIMRAAQTAADLAASRGEAPNKADLYAGAQAHASLRLGHLANRVVPRATWNDLILPPDPLTQLHEVCDRMRYTYVVNEEWGFGSKLNRGISALFAGESGTGKTLAVEVVAGELGLAVYKIDLSSVVSKYIGETEKNLNTIFTEAHAGNAILFFDEADALFGKRSEVKDARDRYANIEVAYLLQQVESYDGVVILATNFRHNLDDAFTRRLDFVVDFPFPDADYRRRIWEVHFPARAPLSPDVNLGEIAAQYRLAGGNIRNAALAAAYLAAANGRVITPAHIRGAIRREHQKMGRLLEE
jgi:AAA+ superfamily predicted ATPase